MHSLNIYRYYPTTVFYHNLHELDFNSRPTIVLLFKEMHVLQVCLCQTARGIYASNSIKNEPERLAVRWVKEGARWHARVEVGKHNVVNDIMAKGHRLRKRRMVQKEMYLNTFKKITMERTD